MRDFHYMDLPPYRVENIDELDEDLEGVLNRMFDIGWQLIQILPADRNGLVFAVFIHRELTAFPIVER